MLAPIAHTHSVVLADRNRHIRSLLARELEGQGFEVTCCGLGREAVALARKQGEILVVDGDLSDMDALSVIRQVREARPELPIVVHAHSADEAVQCLQERFVLFVPKEQDPARLARVVRKALETRPQAGCAPEFLVDR